MFVTGFGETLAYAMTVNPALASLPSASSILDTSNYTFQAVTFGKDAQGFDGFHAHAIVEPTFTVKDAQGKDLFYDLLNLIIVDYGYKVTNQASSYSIQSTHENFSATYDSVPNDPFVGDIRLERGSTRSSNLSNYVYADQLPDSGHYPNPALDSNLSAIWNKLGGFTPKTGGSYQFYHASGGAAKFTGTLSSTYNASGLMDKDGFLTVSPISVVGRGSVANECSAGSVLVSATATEYSPSSGGLELHTVVFAPDAATLAAFGGIKHLGIYCLDMESMLSEGLLPPYSWNALNNNRKYRLVAKSTFLDDPLYHTDQSVGPVDFSGYQVLANSALFTKGGPTIIVKFDFR